MRRILWISGCLIVCGITTFASAQFAPPGGGGGDFAPAGSDAGGGGAVSISPPVTESQRPPTVRSSQGRPNQSFTTNALIGFVNDEPVYVMDILRPLDKDLKRLAAAARNTSEFASAAKPLIDNELQSKVREMMMVTAAKHSLTADDNEKLKIIGNKDRNELITKYGGVVTVAERMLQATGSSVQKELEELRQKHIVEFYIFKNISYKIEITRSMVKGAYDKDPKRWQQEATIELFTITLPITRWLRTPTQNGTLGPVMDKPTPEQIKNAENQALATANEIVAKLNKGEDFATLAESYNSRDTEAINGGRAPGLTKGHLQNTKLEDFVFSLPANTIGAPQLLRDADFNNTLVVVAKVGDKKEARIVSFTEAQGQIDQKLREQRFRELQDEEFKKLAQTAAVEALDRNIDLLVDTAVSRYFSK